MGAARKKVNMETVEITKIINRIEKGKASPSDLATVRKSLTLLKAAQETLIDGDDVHEEDLKIVGKAAGNRLKAAREKKNLNQEQLEKLSKISQSAISKIESGRKMISTQEAIKLAKVLGVTPQHLIAGE